MKFLSGLPAYEEIKALPLDKEYVFHIFEIIHDVYVRVTYNEDDNKGLFLDVMSGGCSDHITPYGCECNKYFKLNKQNYNKILTNINKIRELVIKNVSEVKK